MGPPFMYINNMERALLVFLLGFLVVCEFLLDLSNDTDDGPLDGVQPNRPCAYSAGLPFARAGD